MIEHNNTSIIYILKNKINEKLYVGQTLHLKSRLLGHKQLSNKESIIDRAINKYGWENFEKYLIYVPENLLDFFEIEMIAILNTIEPDGYNLARGGSGNGKHTEATKEKIRRANQGKKHTEVSRAKMSKNRMGHHHSKETITKMSGAHKDKVFSEEHKNNLSKACMGRKGKKGEEHPMYGKHHNDESKAAISKSHKGLFHSDESKKKMSVVTTGEKNGFYGKHHSEASRMKMRKARKRRKQIMTMEI